MKKILKGLLIYNGIVILISGLFVLFSLNRFSFEDFFFFAIPRILITSITISIIWAVFKGRINTGGIIGILIWIAAQTGYIIWGVLTME
jgi:hypothetical protein